MSGRFDGKVAIVTGGASGLGAAIVGGLAREGATVAVADVDGAAAATVAGRAGARAEAVTADVTRAADVAALVEGVVARHGRLDVLVCSAAVETRASVVDCTDEDWQHVLDVNLKGPFLCLKHTLPALARDGGGAAVLMGSVLGAMGSPGYAAYCASKGALVNLAKQAAIEHAPHGVRVNVVSPSATDTGLFAAMAARSGDPDALKARVAAGTPMGRLGTAAEVVAAVLFLAGDDAAYVSGTVLPVDGGAAARRQ